MPVLLLILLAFVVAATALYGPQAAALVEMFPTRVRYTAMSFPYHVGTGWVGGFLPVTSFALVAMTGNIYAGLWYSVVFTAISVVVSILFLKETAGRPLDKISALRTPVDVDRLFGFGEHAPYRKPRTVAVRDRAFEQLALLRAGDGDEERFARHRIAARVSVTRATGASAGSGSGITPTARRALGASSAARKSGPAKIDAV